MSGSENQSATKDDLNMLRGDVTAVNGKVSALSDKVNTLDGKVNTLDGKVNALDGKVNALDGKVNTLDGKVDMLTGEVSDIKRTMLTRADMRELLRPVVATLANHTAELADIRGHIKDKMVTRDEFHARMDAFAGRVDDFDYSSAKNRSRIDDHEKRLRALEDKRA